MMDTPNAYLGPWYRKPGEKVAMIHDEQAKIKHDLRIGDIIKVTWCDDADWHWFRYLGPRNTPSGWGIELQSVTDYEDQSPSVGDTILVTEGSFTVTDVIPREESIATGFPWDMRPNHSSATPVELSDSGSPVIFAVLRDLTTRAEFGERKYGTLLRTDNGRKALQDAYEESLDLAMYLKQALMEGK